VAKTRKTLLSNEKIWNALVKSSFRPIAVQFQAAKLMKQLTLSEEKHLPLYLSKKTSDRLKLLINWLQSDHVPLVCTALEIVSNLSENKHPHTIRNDLIQMGTLDILRSRMVEAKENQDCRMMAALLHTIQRLSRPFSFSSSSSENEEVFILDKDSLSTWYYDENAVDNPTNDPNEDFFSHPHPHAVMNKKSISGGSGDKYVEGWIELFSSFLRVNKNNYQIQKEAILCLEQIVLHGKYRHQALQEWLFAALDAVLEQVPIEIAITARSVRDAKKSRTRPMIGKIANEKDYEESHAKALRALAFVLDRKECQQEFLRFGGIELLRSLISSPNPNIKRELVRLIANVLACDEMNQEMMSHLVFLQQNEEDDIRTLLTLWATEENKDVKLQSLAHRALLNLNYQKQKHMIKDENNRKSTVKYLDGVNPLHCSNMDEEDYNVDVIFLHGLLGCAHETWICGRNDCESEKHNDIEDYEKNATDVWAKKWLVEDLKKQGWKPRVLSIGYDSNLLASDSVWETRNFKKTSEQILFKLQKAQVGGGSHSKRRPVLFVTHSLGGVLLKQVLLDSAAESNHHRNCNCRRIACEKCDHDDNGCNDDDSLLDHVNGVIFYGVPHHGSPIAQTIQNFKIKSLGIHQHPVTEHLHGTPHLQMLNDWCKNVFERRGISALSLGENLPCKLPVIGFEALVVPPSSADPGFGEFVSLGDATHTNVCKPSSKEDQRYLLAKEFIIKQLLKQNQQSQALASSLDVI
jgi:hypothetical protein